jgi:hypothetical protein
MKNIFTAFPAVAMLSFIFSMPANALECPPFPQQASKDLEAEVKAVVGQIGPVKGGELSARTQTATKDLISRLPNADRIFLEQMMYAAYCSGLRDDKQLSEGGKTQQLRIYNLELRQAIYGKSPQGSKPSPEQTLPSVHQYEDKGIIGKLEECKIFANQVTCYIEFKSADLSEKGIGLWKSTYIMYDNKSVPHKAYAVFLVNEERKDDGLKRKIPPGGTAEGRVVFNDVASETEKISELRVHTVIHGGYGVWSQHPFKFYNISLSKEQYSKPR